ncbi:MAG: hypothetical protein MHPSP_003771 [Paramarteilia canceri]
MRSFHSLSGVQGVLCQLHGVHIAIKETLSAQNSVTDFDEDESCSEDDENDENIDHIMNIFPEDIATALKKMKTIIGIFKRSGILHEKLANQCKIDSKPTLTFISIIEIRWNSIFYS